MKHTDDYEAKLRLWATDRRVWRMPRPVGLPPFTPRKFASYAEMNAWKREYLDRIAAVGGVTWTK